MQPARAHYAQELGDNSPTKSDAAVDTSHRRGREPLVPEITGSRGPPTALGFAKQPPRDPFHLAGIFRPALRCNRRPEGRRQAPFRGCASGAKRLDVRIRKWCRWRERCPQSPIHTSAPIRDSAAPAGGRRSISRPPERSTSRGNGITRTDHRPVEGIPLPNPGNQAVDVGGATPNQVSSVCQASGGPHAGCQSVCR